tara:strand:+ start:5274 stop:5609 length:336 start_codon:yes stop_codon:yes gene_type:complete
MKIAFIDSLLNKFKKRSQKKGVIKSGQIRVRLHWNILLLIFVMLLFAVGAGGYYAYTNFVSREGKLENNGEDNNTTLDTKLLDEVLDDFETRQDIFEEVFLNPPNIIDPSL